MSQARNGEQILSKQWVAILHSLLVGNREEAQKTALNLFAPDGLDEINAPKIEAELANEILLGLAKEKYQLPENGAFSFGKFSSVTQDIYRDIKRNPARSEAVEMLIVFLRLIRLVVDNQTPVLFTQIIMDYAAGLWLPHRTKPELFQIENALSQTLLSMSPERLRVFWSEAGGRSAHSKRMAQIALNAMRDAHAVPHLLYTLENIHNNDTKSEIVDILEQIGEPSALPVLMRLKMQKALTDWPLSRHIGRAVKVIELHNRSNHYGTLLRSSEAPPANPGQLLRPADSAQFDAERDKGELLRPDSKPTEDNL